MTSDGTTTPAAPATFTEQEISAALNQAADDILDAVDAGDEGLRDGLNLMVNTTLAYLRGEAADLHEVAEGSYGEDLDTILGWIGEAA